MRYSSILVLMCLVSSEAAAQTSAVSPVALHAGIAYTALADTEFEAVQALSGQDLFGAVRERESRADFGVFVSQRLWSGEGGGIGAYATLGTNVSRPGDVLFLGGSLSVSRAMVTVGGATGLVAEGVSPVRDEVFRGSGDRGLFATVWDRREWAFFAAVSFAVLR